MQQTARSNLKRLLRKFFKWVPDKTARNTIVLVCPQYDRTGYEGGHVAETIEEKSTTVADLSVLKFAE